MAEALAVIAVIASVAQLADLGCKLSVKLFAFSQSAATADESIRGISSDVSLTSTVLQELSLIIKADESRIVSSTAIEATKQTVAECLKIFEQLDEALEKTIGNSKENSRGKGKRGMSTFEKLKFPFKQPKLDLLRSNLERLKTSLSLMLQVLSYARDVSDRKAAETSLAYQQHMIEALARSQQLAETRYQSLKKALEYQEHPQTFNAFVSTSVDPSSFSGLDRPLIGPDSITAKLEPEDVEPPTSSKTLVHELLLCFKLLDEVMLQHIIQNNPTDRIISDYDELKKATSSIKKQETSSLGYDPIYKFPQAAKILTGKLEKLSTPGSYVPPSYKPKVFDSASYESPSSISTWGIQHDAQDHGVESVLSSELYYAMSCSPSTPLQPIAQSHKARPLFSSEEELLKERGKRYMKIGRAGKKHFPEDFVSPIQTSSAVTIQESVTAGPFHRDAELSTISPRSTAWGNIKSAGAMAGKGLSKFGSELYVAVGAGNSRLIADSDDGRNMIKTPRPVTVKQICALQRSDPMDDNGIDDGSDADITRDIIEDLLAKWTNLPPRNAHKISDGGKSRND